MLLLSACLDILGAMVQRKVLSTQKADFSDHNSAKDIKKALQAAAASVTRHPPCPQPVPQTRVSLNYTSNIPCSSGGCT